MTSAPNKILTLCLVVDSGRVLLGMKKRGFGAGWWNGFGGKLESGETVEQAARREMLEEVGVTIVKMDRVGLLEFEFHHKPEIHEVHLFKVTSFEGTPSESEEMRPRWFGFDEIPFESMWPDDPHWFPLFLEGRPFKGRFHFGPDHKMLDFVLTETDTF